MSDELIILILLIILLSAVSCTQQEVATEIKAAIKHSPGRYALIGPGECAYIDWPEKALKLCMTEGEVFVPEKVKVK